MATGWYVVEPPTSGLLDAIKSQPAKALMVGQNTYSGSLTASVKAALANFQGGQFVSGVATMLANKPTASMNGIFYSSANLAATTKKATASMSGVSENRATLVSIIAKATASLGGSQIATGVLAATAKAASGAFGDANSALGNIPITLPTVQASLAGNLVHSGIMSGMLKPIGAALAGYQNPQGTIAATVAKAIAQANGGQDIPGTFAVALAKAQAAMASEQAQAGTASMSAKAATFGATSINPPTFNSVGASASGSNGFITSLSASETHPLASGTRRFAVAAMTYRCASQDPNPTNQVNNRVQWGGVDMTFLGWLTVNSETGLAIYGYAIPDSDAAGNVTVGFRTGKSANTGRALSGLSVVYNGSSGVLLDAFAENSIGSTSLAMASTANEIALGTFGAVSGLTGVAGSGQTVRGNTNGGGGFTAVSLVEAPGDTSVTVAATGAKAAYGVRILA